MSTHTTVARLAEQHTREDLFVQALSTRPATRCPRHPQRLLEGGPTHYRCPEGHGVPAGDIDREVRS